MNPSIVMQYTTRGHRPAWQVNARLPVGRQPYRPVGSGMGAYANARIR